MPIAPRAIETRRTRRPRPASRNSPRHCTTPCQPLRRSSPRLPNSPPISTAAARPAARWSRRRPSASRTRRDRARPSSCSRCRARPRPRRAGTVLVAARGHSRIGQGPVSKARSRARTRVFCPARERRDRRTHQHERVRVFGAGPQSSLRHAALALSRGRAGRCAHYERPVFGRSGIGRGRHGRQRARHRHRRLNPHSRRDVRPDRLQADHGPHPKTGRRAAVEDARLLRSHRPYRCIVVRWSTAFSRDAN